MNGRILFLEIAGDAADRAAGADAGHPMGDASSGLAPDLRAGGGIVGARVVLVEVLVGQESLALVADAFSGLVVGARIVGAHVRGAEDDLDAVCGQQRAFFDRCLVGHGADHLVALEDGGDGEPETGVAGGRLDDGVPGTQLAGRLGSLDHRQADAVLDAAAGIEELELCRHARGSGGVPIEAYQGGLAERGEYVFENFHRIGASNRRIGLAATAGNLAQRSGP